MSKMPDVKNDVAKGTILQYHPNRQHTTSDMKYRIKEFKKRFNMLK